MKVLTGISAAILFGLVQSDPIILSRDDIGDNYYVVPADFLGPKMWLGLFITGTESQVEGRESHLRVARVRVVTRRESGQTIYRIVTTPPDASLLVSAVPGVSAGPVVTVGVFIDLGSEKLDAEFRLGKQLYTIRLDSTVPDHCDGVITLTSGGRMQRLFDATRPGATRQPGLVVACDDPHFKIHWVGDLDRDGRLDMLVTFSHKYSYFPTQLLLSSAARPLDLVGEVARYERFAE